MWQDENWVTTEAQLSCVESGALNTDKSTQLDWKCSELEKKLANQLGWIESGSQSVHSTRTNSTQPLELLLQERVMLYYAGEYSEYVWRVTGGDDSNYKRRCGLEVLHFDHFTRQLSIIARPNAV